ncbi:MAG TPA: DUF59 domain-containing protein, partial [Nannocystis exedens]|nr:DUF59 domain-containing protein [Nannocystis exedens]
MTIDSDVIKRALSQISDPATGRSLTAGQLGAVEIDGNDVKLAIDLISPGYPLLEEFEAAIRGALAELPGVGSVAIDYGLKVPSKPARQDLNRLPTVKNVIAIAAGKGGVGKSTISVNTAMALHRMGAKVGILDA